MAELLFVVRKAKARRAPGPDLLPIDAVKLLERGHLEALLDIFNRCWREGVFPQIWKKARITILRKAGERDWADPGSYRPISLLPVLEKTLERLVHLRLMREIQDRGLISANQYGFMPGRGTTDALLKITQSVMATQRKHAVGIFLDIKGAFIELRWTSILRGLRAIDVNPRIFRMLCSYLEDRTLTMTTGFCQVEREVDMGCPQGSVLGPVLWNIVLEGLLRTELPEDVEILAFADDTILLAYGDSRLIMERHLQLAIASIEEWAQDVKLTFSTRKTKAMYLKGSLSMARPPTLRIGGSPVMYYKQVVFLGVTLDRKLTFLPHVKEVCSRARTLFGKVVRLIRLKYGVQEYTLSSIRQFSAR